MKPLTILIRAELEIPDDWEVAEHPSGMQVLKIGDRYIDFDIAPLATRSTSQEAEWSDADSEVIDEVLDSILSVDVELEIQMLH